MEEANKLTLGQPLEVQTPHQVPGILEIKGHHWLTRGHLIQYQPLLLDSSGPTLKTCHTLNLHATFMPAESPELAHSSLETLDQVYACRSDRTDQAVENHEEEWFTGGNSFVKDGGRRAGYAIVSTHSIRQAKSLLPNTSAQKAELITLVCQSLSHIRLYDPVGYSLYPQNSPRKNTGVGCLFPLQGIFLTQGSNLGLLHCRQILYCLSHQGEGKFVNINTNSKYAFLVLHAHTASWKDRRLLNARNSPIKYGAEILHLIEAVHKPKQVAVTPATGSKRELLKFPEETTGRIRKQRKQL